MQRQDFNCLVHIKNSEKDERSLHFLRVEVETFLIINWYRPGASDHDDFKELRNELKTHTGTISGTVIAGDLNVHHRKWLRFSNSNTKIGEDLKKLCDYYGMWQMVKEPTRNEYL